jgi:hypothetical protein
MFDRECKLIVELNLSGNLGVKFLINVCVLIYLHYHLQNSPFTSIAFLEGSVRFDPVFIYLDFATISFTEQRRQPRVKILPWSTRSLYLGSVVTGWRIYTPRHRVSLLLIFYDSQGYGGGILPRLRTGCFDV